MEKKVAIIAGAGPAGLTTALQLLEETNVTPIIFEETGYIGGISRTAQYNGNRIDIGGHRFFSKSSEVTDFWERIMPLQGAPSKDDLLLGTTDFECSQGGPDPETQDIVMLSRRRVSRIFFLRKFFDYPISMKKETFTNMGLANTMRAGMGYLWSCIHKLPETNLENFYINRFGRPLYEMFFEGYTEKVWGIHPSKLGADWGSQRVKGLSIMAVIKDMLAKASGRKDGKGKSKEVQTSLIEQFIYPKYGPGQLWETVADQIRSKGGTIELNAKVTNVEMDGNRVKSVTVAKPDGEQETFGCDYFISSMPIKDLVASISGTAIPENVCKTAHDLPYRDFITVGLCVDKLKIINHTKFKTYAQRVPDTWIYIQERDVRIGRLQIFNNWSPYMVKDYENTMWIGLEYFCTEGDDMWNMSDGDFIDMAISELEKIDILDKADVLDACRIKVKKAYPAYYGSYYQLDCVRAFLDRFDNLFCIGRNGQHRYNNMDHSMLTAMECVKNIKSGSGGKENIWNVNTEEEYHESKK